jgi:hypothetical protein
MDDPPPLEKLVTPPFATSPKLLKVPQDQVQVGK